MEEPDDSCERRREGRRWLHRPIGGPGIKAEETEETEDMFGLRSVA